MYLAKYPVFEAQRYLRDTFGFHFKIPGSRGHRGQVRHFSEQPIEIIDFMAERQNYSAAQLCPRHIALPVIFVRMPIRQVLTNPCPNAKHIPDYIFTQLFSQKLQSWVKSQVVADARD